MKIRSVKSSDYYVISPLLNAWWGGRQMADMLPKLFFDYFQDTSFIVEKDEQIIGFLIGFLSQTNSEVAYIHFVGVHPEYRNLKIGKQLYNEFFNTVKQKGVGVVRCVTSPVNKVSIAYHTKMGFDVEPGDLIVEGISIHKDYDGPNKDRILFKKKLV